MNSQRVRLTVMLVILALVAIGLFYQESMKRRAAPPVPSAPPAPSAKPLTAGNTDAPIKVNAFYPLNEGHKFIGDYLIAFAKAHPDQVYVTVTDMQSQEGRKAWEGSGLTCAGVLVNGTTKHELKRNGKTETVDLTKRMGINWQQQDFEDLVKQLLAAKDKPAAANPA